MSQKSPLQQGERLQITPQKSRIFPDNCSLAYITRGGLCGSHLSEPLRVSCASLGFPLPSGLGLLFHLGGNSGSLGVRISSQHLLFSSSNFRKTLGLASEDDKQTQQRGGISVPGKRRGLAQCFPNICRVNNN